MKPRRSRSSSRKPARSLRVRAAFLLLALLPSAMALASQPMSPQGAHDTTVGPGGGLTPLTSPTGGFPTAVAMELPPSRDGIPTPFQVRHTASPRMGAAGMSWEVPLSYVRVSTSTMRRKPSVEHDGSDALAAPRRVFVALDGSPTLMVPGDSAGKYVPFVASQYMELRQVGAGWRLDVLGGVQYVFEPVSTLSSGGLPDPGLFLLKEIRQVAGSDRLTLDYEFPTCQPGAPSINNPVGVELTTIKHTFDGTTPLFEVVATYDQSQGGYYEDTWDEGYETVRCRLLQRVDVNARNNLSQSNTTKRVRAYTFDYDQDPITGRPRLAGVDLLGEEGMAGPGSLPVARYQYGGLAGYGQKRLIPRSFNAPSAPPQYSDMSDEYADSLSSSAVEVTEFSHSNTTAKLERVTTRHVIRDFTGDGLPDLVFKAGDVWTVYPNRTTDAGTRFDVSAPITWTEPAEIFEQTTFQFTGLTIANNAKAREAMVTTETWRQFLDWNGDGRMDVVDARGGDETYYWKVWINEGDWGGQMIWREENVFIDELRPSGTDVDHPYRDLQDQIDDVIWDPHFPDRFDVGADGRFPLERSRSWPRTFWSTCHATRNDAPIPCDVPTYPPRPIREPGGFPTSVTRGV